MKKNANILWVSALILGWLFDVLFWGQSVGINFPIYVILCLASGLLLLRTAQQDPARSVLWLLLPAIFFMCVAAVRTEPMTVFLSMVFTILSMGLMAISYVGGRWVQFSLADYFAGFLGLLGSMISRPITHSIETRREEKENGTSHAKLNLWPILRGIVIAIPILAIFAGLLSSADSVFSKELNDFIRLFFDAEKIPEYIFRFVYILVLGYALAGAFLHAGSRSTNEQLLGIEKPLVPQFLGFTETTIILGSVILLFGAFVLVQFQYFFGGQANLGAGGLTDSEYARRGFGELAAVAFLSLLMILGLSTITRRSTNLQRRIYSGLSVGVVALVMVILVSAYQRLLLNELAHGFFRLRTYSHVFYVWLALLLLAVVILEILHRERAFALAAIIASLGFAGSLSVLNVDAFTARQSIIRASNGYYLNVSDIAALSDDAVPALADGFLSPALSENLREQIGVILVCHQAGQARSGDQTNDWRSLNFSRWAADQAMQRAEPYLAGYKVNTQTWPWRVHVPNTLGYVECQYSYGD